MATAPEVHRLRPVLMPEGIVARPEVVKAYIRERDIHGTPGFTKVGMPMFAKHIHGFMDQWTQIPGDYWAQMLNDDGYTAAEVACPCGEAPKVEVGGSLSCECGRIFWFAFTDVWVANSPLNGAAQETQTPDRP
jgi:hypothetical protein